LNVRLKNTEVRIGFEDASTTPSQIKITANELCGKILKEPKTVLHVVECHKALKGNIITIQKHLDSPQGDWVLDINELDVIALT